MENINIRKTEEKDIDTLVNLDTIVPSDESRQEEIRSWGRNGECYLAELEGEIAGYGAFNYELFHQGNIDMLMIGKNYRQKGIGRKLLNYFISNCKTNSFWCTTNSSNHVMQNLLESEGFKMVGQVENYLENDPELFYFKRVREDGVEIVLD